MSDHQWETDLAWELTSWQNRLAASLLLAWTVWIAAAKGRTPVELVTPRLDRLFVDRVRAVTGTRAAATPEPAQPAG